MDIHNDFSFRWGVITFLDFLGWKGVWMNDYKKGTHPVNENGQYMDAFNSNSLQELATLIQKIKDLCKSGRITCELISISDTIVLFSPCQNKDAGNYETLKYHSRICSKIMDMSADAGFPLRGAITIGNYAYYENIIVGPGVDECASWYEETNWLGVIFAPSAQFIIERQEEQQNKTLGETAKRDKTRNLWSDAKIVKYEHIPIKSGFRGIKYCVDWGSQTTILNKILKNTISLSREIAVKYINTNEYLYTLRPEEETNDENQ